MDPCVYVIYYGKTLQQAYLVQANRKMTINVITN